MPNADYYLHRSWNVICDRCDGKFKAHQLKREWTGLMVCKGCWDPKDPQDFVKVTKDKQSVPWSRPKTEDVFIEGPACTICDRQSIAGIGKVGCIQAGLNSSLGTICTDEYTGTP